MGGSIRRRMPLRPPLRLWNLPAEFTPASQAGHVPRGTEFCLTPLIALV